MPEHTEEEPRHSVSLIRTRRPIKIRSPFPSQVLLLKRKGVAPCGFRMEPTNGSEHVRSLDEGKVKDNQAYIQDLKNRADEVSSMVDKFEQRLDEVQKFYANTRKKQPNACKGLKEKDKAKDVSMRQLNATDKKEAATKRRQELMRQFGLILHQITQHKWADPFLKPVDAVGLGLTDYFKVIEKPMDFETIRNRIKAKDGTGYKTIREICSDVRLIFKNAMKYNDERDDVHVMAKTLLAKFEEKWLQLLPKFHQEEKLSKEEEEEAQLEMQRAQEALYGRRAMDLSTELDDFDAQLTKLREEVLQKCRKFTSEDKVQLIRGLSRLSPEDFSRALQIVVQMNPSFDLSAEEVDLDIDSQSEDTLWRLKIFVKEALENRDKTSASNTSRNKQPKRQLRDALAKCSNKRSKKLS